MRTRPDKTSAWVSFRKVLPWLLVAAVGVLVITQHRGNDMTSSGPAPAVTGSMADGSQFDLASRRGKVTVLAFWATWCPACRAEGPMLDRVHRQIQGRGDAIVGLSVDTMPVARVEHFARRLGMSYPIARIDRSITTAYNVDLLPSLVVVDAEGNIARTFAGTVGERELLQAIEAAR